MTIAGDPAPTAIEPRTPTPYRGIGAAALIGAAVCIIVLAAQLGASPHAPVTPWILALALGVDIGVQFGLWGMREHRLDQRENATRTADETRYSTWLNTEEQCETWHAQQYQVLSDQNQQINTRMDGFAADVAAQLRDQVAEEVTRAVRSAHSAGYVAGVAARQSGAAVNGSGGNRLRLIEPDSLS